MTALRSLHRPVVCGTHFLKKPSTISWPYVVQRGKLWGRETLTMLACHMCCVRLSSHQTLSTVLVDELSAGREGKRAGWLGTSDGHTWVPRRVCRVLANRQFHNSPTQQRATTAAVDALPKLTAAAVAKSKMKTQQLRRGGEKVDLDCFLRIMLAAWEEQANLLREQWAQVFFFVDVDGNQQLDFDEFKQVRNAIVGGLPWLACLVLRVFRLNTVLFVFWKGYGHDSRCPSVRQSHAVHLCGKYE